MVHGTVEIVIRYRNVIFKYFVLAELGLPMVFVGCENEAERRVTDETLVRLYVSIRYEFSPSNERARTSAGL